MTERGAEVLFDEVQAASAGGLTVVVGPSTPLDSVYIFDTADVRHQGAGTSHVAIAMLRGGAVVLLVSSRQSGPGTPVAADEAVYLPRPVRVPPGWSLLFIAQGLGLGELVQGRMVYRRESA